MITDDDRERVLWLVLREAEGENIREEIEQYPVEMRNKFRKVVQEAGLVKSGPSQKGDGGELLFGKNTTVTERGKRRLQELGKRLQ